VKKRLVLGIVLALSTCPLYADTTITVPAGFTGNDGTCLSRLYNDVLIPANYGLTASGNPTAPTQFAQSTAGALGLTIFFETRPNVEPNGPPVGAAMAGIGYVDVNRFHTSGFINRNLKSLKAVVKDSSVIWAKTSSNKYDGTADLIGADGNLLASTMTGSQSSGDCAGLIWSFEVALSVLYMTDSGDPGHNTYRIAVESYFPNALWWRSSSGSPDGKSYLVNSVLIPSCGGQRTLYFWGETGVKWTGQSY